MQSGIECYDEQGLIVFSADQYSSYIVYDKPHTFNGAWQYIRGLNLTFGKTVVLFDRDVAVVNCYVDNGDLGLIGATSIGTVGLIILKVV